MVVPWGCMQRLGDQVRSPEALQRQVAARLQALAALCSNGASAPVCPETRALTP